jgi:hypothetical protein
MPAIADPSPWQLPAAFVIRFDEPPPIKRVFPFDSGAFHQRRLPDYITMFRLDGFNLAGDSQLIGRLVNFYFKSHERFFFRQPAGEQELREQHNLDMRHAQVMALSRLFLENSSPAFDDRAAAIELQIEQDIELRPDNLLGVVMPAEYARVDEFMADLRTLTHNIETYDHMPLGTDSHYAYLYEGVKRIYKQAGIPFGA